MSDPAGVNDLLESTSAAIVRGVLDGVEPGLLLARVLADGARRLAVERISLASIAGDEVRIEGLTAGIAPSGRAAPTYHKSSRVARAAEILAHPVVRAAIDARGVATGRGLDIDRTDQSKWVVDLRHLAVAPFFVDKHLLGMLTVSRPRSREFVAADMRALQELADLAGLVLQQAQVRLESDRARELAQSSADRLRLALDAAKDVAVVDDIHEVTRRLLSRAAAAVAATRGALSRLDGAHLNVEMTLRSQGDPALGSRIAVASIPAAARALEARSTVLALPSRRRDASSSGRRVVDYWLYCPLIAGGEVVGVLQLGRAGRSFAPDDLVVLDHFAAVAALLVRSARLLKEAWSGAEQRSRFMNLAAHELRTPLSVIKGYISLMRDGTLPVADGTAGAVEILDQKTRELSALVESLLHAARLEAGALTFAPALTDLAEMAREAGARLAPRLELGRGRLRLRLPDEPVRVSVDKPSISRVIDNLLNNAVDYSPDGAEVTLTVRVAGDRAELLVKDRGSGIPKSEQGRIFERFFRGKTAYSTAGVGLGLAISLELATAAGGSLQLLRSRPEQGSVFRLTLPLALDSPDSATILTLHEPHA